MEMLRSGDADDVQVLGLGPKVLDNDTYCVGQTGDIETHMDARLKGIGQKSIAIGPLELIELVECTDEDVREIERQKTLEYTARYGEDRVTRFVFEQAEGVAPKMQSRSTHSQEKRN